MPECKYCTYARQNVAVSNFNNNGLCRCMNCAESTCQIDCLLGKEIPNYAIRKNNGTLYRGSCNACVLETRNQR